jgi:hypothetical protein
LPIGVAETWHFGAPLWRRWPFPWFVGPCLAFGLGYIQFVLAVWCLPEWWPIQFVLAVWWPLARLIQFVLSVWWPLAWFLQFVLSVWWPLARFIQFVLSVWWPLVWFNQFVLSSCCLLCRTMPIDKVQTKLWFLPHTLIVLNRLVCLVLFF